MMQSNEFDNISKEIKEEPEDDNVIIPNFFRCFIRRSCIDECKLIKDITRLPNMLNYERQSGRKLKILMNMCMGLRKINWNRKTEKLLSINNVVNSVDRISYRLHSSSFEKKFYLQFHFEEQIRNKFQLQLQLHHWLNREKKE